MHVQELTLLGLALLATNIECIGVGDGGGGGRGGSCPPTFEGGGGGGGGHCPPTSQAL